MSSKIHFVKTPSAWFPIAMSVAALILVVTHVSIFGYTQQQDEGVAARIFQLLLVGQIPIIVFFAVKWLHKNQNQALQILLLQLFAGLMAFATVFFLEL